MAKMTKSQIVTEISKDTGLTRKNVNAVFDALQGLAKAQLGKKGPGEFTILPGLIKAQVKIKPAIKAGKWLTPSPRGEIRKAKPAPHGACARQRLKAFCNARQPKSIESGEQSGRSLFGRGRTRQIRTRRGRRTERRGRERRLVDRSAS